MGNTSGWMAQHMTDEPNPACPFLEELLRRRPEWSELPIIDQAAHPWPSRTLVIPSPPGSDLACPLDIEETAGEVTISLDHCHIHMPWPPGAPGMAGPVWSDPLAMIEAIVDEKVLATSGWIGGRVRIGSIQEAGDEKPLSMSNLQRQRWRSWKGTFDRDETLS